MPIEEVKDQDYAKLIEKIKEQERQEIIKKVLLGKATGPKRVSNEMLKKLPKEEIKILIIV